MLEQDHDLRFSETSLSRRVREAAPGGPLAWVSMLAEVLAPWLEARGEQTRSVHIETLCSGTGSPTYGLGVQFLAASLHAESQTCLARRQGGFQEHGVNRERQAVTIAWARGVCSKQSRRAFFPMSLVGVFMKQQECLVSCEVFMCNAGTAQVLKKLKFCEKFSVDVKPASAQFLAVNGWGECHFRTVAEVVKAYSDPEATLYCSKHKGPCRVGFASSTRDLLIVGFPCSPYSVQRRERWAKG